MSARGAASPDRRELCVNLVAEFFTLAQRGSGDASALDVAPDGLCGVQVR